MKLKAGMILAVLTIVSTMVRAQHLNDVIITEIMADPTPRVGLPEVEYIELYNRTTQPVSLKGWTLSMGSRSAVLPDSILPPFSYLLVCHRNDLAQMQPYGRVLGLANFLLPNEGAVLSLYLASKRLIYSILYSQNWWPTGKKDGGYALELLDLDNPCLERENWSVSVDQKGGTPNRTNSINKSISDKSALSVERIDVVSDLELALQFNRRLDSLSAVAGAGINVAGRQIVRKRLDSPSFKTLTLTFDSPLLKSTSYILTIHNLADCAGHFLRDASLPVGVPADADSNDVVINEVLFNPYAGGVDFVEIYNRSPRFVKLSGWSLGNTRDGVVDVKRDITNENVVLPPMSFLALTTDPDVVKRQYPLSQSGRFLALTAMPAFVNEQGGVVLLDQARRIHDQFLYSEKMHHPLIDDPKGVSLERIDPAKPASDASNWQSAASTNGYATPGYVNSQVIPATSDEDFVIEPEVFTPDMDGRDDVAEIRFTQKWSGRMATIRVFDVNGRLVKPLIENLLIGTQGKVFWDGTDMAGKRVKTGYYLIMIDTFDLSGNKRQFRKKVVVANE
jgi:hypothetical protein